MLMLSRLLKNNEQDVYKVYEIMMQTKLNIGYKFGIVLDWYLMSNENLYAEAQPVDWTTDFIYLYLFI